MKKKELLRFYQVAAAILLLVSLYLFSESSKWLNYSAELENKNAELNATLALTQDRLASERSHSATLENELEATKSTLIETNASLNQCYSDLEDETQQLGVCLSRNEELSTFLLKTKDELENLSAELRLFQDQIEQSMSWFIDNSNMEGMPLNLKYQIDKCTSNTEINAPCIPTVMKEEKQWAYKREEDDRLLSLDEMLINNGGDCEDWSLFFKAAYNYLREEDKPERYIVSAVPGRGTFKIYDDYFYADAERKEVGTTEDNIYVICYDSHCIVAVSDHEIKSSEDVYNLDGAPAIEPQNGQYMFTIGSMLAPSICTPDECDYSDIWLIITDDDIYDFHYNRRWVSYKDYYSAAAYYKEKVDAMSSLIEQTAG